MEFNIKNTAFILICTILAWRPAFGQNGNAQPMYDVIHSLHEISENVQNAQHLETIQYNVDIKDQGRSFKMNVLNSLLSILNETTNSSCRRDIIYATKFLKLQDLLLNPWAFQMLDAFGKPESGFLQGNLKWLGDFDECRKVYAPKSNDDGDYHGKYCSLGLNITIIPVTIGVCVPETCKPSDFIHDGANISISVFNVNITVTSLTCKEDKRLTGAAIATICVISIFGVLAFLGSSITVAKYLRSMNLRKDPECQQEAANTDQKKEKCKDDDEPLIIIEGSRTKLSIFVEECVKFLKCFCVFTNGAKLLNVDATEGQLLCLHGIRFLSMSWVILCHVYMSPVAQLRTMKVDPSTVDNFAFQAILNGWYSVDSFFLLSGFLMAYLYFQEAAKKKGKTPWLYFYIHRYLRLTPVYMIVLGFSTTIFPFLGSGPFWPDIDIEPNCKESWWWNLIYINNFKDNVHQCMGWAWYLANDMQFFVVSPLFLISLWRWPKIGYTLLAIFLCGNWIVCFVLTYHYNLVAGSLSNVMEIATDPNFIKRWDDYFGKIYIKPYTRDAPYLVGIALGYILFKSKIANFKLNQVTLLVGWLIATPVGLTCVYGLYHRTPGLIAASFFNALTRTSYALALGWVIFVCLLGQGGAVNKILSYKLFIPLSRLTYCAYLIHPIVISTYSMSLRTTLVFSHPTMVVLFLGLIVISYALSLMVSLILESPIIMLEKHIRSKFRS